MTHHEALRILDIPATATKADVRAQYRTLAMGRHPDAGGDAAEFRRLTLARDVALQHAPEVRACTTCAGRGRILQQGPLTSTARLCPSCKGTG